MKKRMLALAAILALTGVVTVGCGGSDKETEAPATEAVTTEAATTEAATEEETTEAETETETEEETTEAATEEETTEAETEEEATEAVTEEETTEAEAMVVNATEEETSEAETTEAVTEEETTEAETEEETTEAETEEETTEAVTEEETTEAVTEEETTEAETEEETTEAATEEETTEAETEEETTEAQSEGGVLVMATNAEFPPYEFHERVDGEDTIVGIDAEVAALIAEELGMTLEIEDMAFDSVLAAVQTGKADIAMAGITVTEERLKSVNFTDSYTTATQMIIVAEDSDIAGPDDLAGKTIGVQLGTTGDIYVEDVEDAKIERYSKGFEAVQALIQGKVDAVVIDGEPAKVFVSQNEGIKLLDEAFTEEEYAIAIAKDNEELLEKVNDALNTLKENGEFQKVVDKYINDDTAEDETEAATEEKTTEEETTEAASEEETTEAETEA